MGHQIEASKDYHRRCEEDRPEEIDCTADMFPEYVQPPGTFSAGMKIEAVDPLNLASVCVATVMQVSFSFQYSSKKIETYSCVLIFLWPRQKVCGFKCLVMCANTQSSAKVCC